MFQDDLLTCTKYPGTRVSSSRTHYPVPPDRYLRLPCSEFLVCTARLALAQPCPSPPLDRTPPPGARLRPSALGLVFVQSVRHRCLSHNTLRPPPRRAPAWTREL
eukprot:3761999-Rhodomonas_salina.3